MTSMIFREVQQLLLGKRNTHHIALDFSSILMSTWLKQFRVNILNFQCLFPPCLMCFMILNFCFLITTNIWCVFRNQHIYLSYCSLLFMAEHVVLQTFIDSWLWFHDPSIFCNIILDLYIFSYELSARIICVCIQLIIFFQLNYLVTDKFHPL